MTIKTALCMIAGLALAAALTYNAALQRAIREADSRAAENLNRATECESVLNFERRARSAAQTVQAYADTARSEIDATRASLVQNIGAIADTGLLDDRVCELAHAAYHSTVCTAAASGPVPAAAGASAP